MNLRPARYLVPTLLGGLLAVGCGGTETREPTQTAAPAEDVGSVASAVGQCSAGFAPLVSYPAGFRATEVATADVNGDGLPDLIASNGYYGTAAKVSVLLNQGNGTFGPETTYPGLGKAAYAVIAADLNGDGFPDIVQIPEEFNTGGAVVLLNHGDGTFGAPVLYPVKPVPTAVAAADLNGDGFPDLVVADEVSGKVHVLLNHGDGTFAASVDYPAAQFSSGVAATDVNGDGLPDIVVASAEGVQVLLNQGNAVFAAPVNYATGGQPYAVAVADLNGDGKPDLAVTNLSGVAVLLNQGNGTFGAASVYDAGSGAQHLAVADVNGDGSPDIAVVAWQNYGGAPVSVLLNQGNGTFGPPVALASGPDAYFVAAADLNADGKIDLAVVVGSSPVVNVLLNTTSCGCTINGMPYAPGEVNPANACQVCTTATSTTAWSDVSDGTACSDGHVCTVGDACQSGTCVGGPISPSCTPVTVTIQRAGTSGTVFDAAIDAELPATNNGASASIPVGLAGGNAGKYRATLMSFDLGVIPAGAFVQSATATLYTYQSSGSQQTFAHEVTVPWAESTVTWGNFPPSGYLAATAATFPGVANIVVTAGTLEKTQADLTALVQAWYTGATPNNGILLEQNLPQDLMPGTPILTGVTAFCSSEWIATDTPADGPTERPALTVTYIPNY
jgi:FG-GAP-like repeat/FG-GAP repeat